MIRSSTETGGSVGDRTPPGQPISLIPIITTTVSTPGILRASRSNRASALTPMRSLSSLAPEIPAFRTPILTDKHARSNRRIWLEFQLTDFVASHQEGRLPGVVMPSGDGCYVGQV